MIEMDTEEEKYQENTYVLRQNINQYIKHKLNTIHIPLG